MLLESVLFNAYISQFLEFKKILLNYIIDSYVKLVRCNLTARCEVLTAVMLKVQFFWDLTLSHSKKYQTFWSTTVDSSFQTLGTTYPLTCHIIPEYQNHHHLTASHYHHIHNFNQFTKNIAYTNGRYVHNLTTYQIFIATIVCQLSVTKSSVTNTEYSSNGSLFIVALSSITHLVCYPDMLDNLKILLTYQVLTHLITRCCILTQPNRLQKPS